MILRYPPSPWRRSLWLQSPGSRVESSSPCRSVAEAGCCMARWGRRQRPAARQPVSGNGGVQGGFLAGMGCCQALLPAQWGAANGSYVGSLWRPVAGRRCGAEAGGRQQPLRLSQRDRRTRPSNGKQVPHSPVDKKEKIAWKFTIIAGDFYTTWTSLHFTPLCKKIPTCRCTSIYCVLWVFLPLHIGGKHSDSKLFCSKSPVFFFP